MRHDLEQSEQEEKTAPQRAAFPWYRALLILLLLMLLGLQYRLWISDGSLAEVHRLKQTEQTLRSSVEQARTRNKAMAAEIKNLKSGNEAMVGRARTDIGMVKKGETFYLTVTPQDEDGKAVTSKPDQAAAETDGE